MMEHKKKEIHLKKTYIQEFNKIELAATSSC